MSEIIIDKNAKQITFTNNGIGFSQFGVANEILDLIENQTKEIEKLNNIIDKKEQFLGDNIKRLEREVVKRDNIINKIDEYVIKLRYYADEEDEGYKISKDIHNILQELKGVDKE